LKITGRQKELFKTSKGKYVAPAPIENELNAHPWVELSVVSGSGREAAYALIVLAEALRPRQAEASTRREIQAELESLLRQVNGRRVEYEHLRMLVVMREPWSVEAGTLTPTMKIRRSRIEAAVAAQREGWFERRELVIWA
jgi:long-subunit acyl-CoA synthetase (AMP-forming)